MTLTREQLLTPRPCCRCGQMMSKEFLIEKERLRIERIRKSLEGKPAKGRARKHDYELMRALRAKGLSYGQIAMKLNVPVSAPRYACAIALP